jgi:hypothetical protein
MLATSQTLPSSKASIVTVESALLAIESAPPTSCAPKGSLCPIAESAERDASCPVLDRLAAAMAGAGRSVAELSLYLGLDEPEIRNRVTALELPAAPEKPLRRLVSANPWSVEEVRRLITLWLDNVSITSIASALGRTPSSIRGKRRWLGLGARVRKELADRPICLATHRGFAGAS